MSLANHQIVDFILALNDVVLYAETETEILTRACRLAVEKGDFRFAWIGTFEAQSGAILPVVYHGYEAGYLDAIHTIRLQHGPASRGPSGRAFREGKLAYSNDLEHDPAMALWKDEALQRGYRSSVGIPLLIGQEVAFVLSLYAETTHRFDSPELALLERLGQNLGYAIGNLRLAQQSRLQQQQLLELSAAVQQTDVGVLMTDLDGTVLFVNPGFCRMSGYAESEIVGVNVNRLASGQMSDAFYATLWRQLAADETWRGVFENKRKDGSLYWESSIISPVFDAAGKKFRYISLKQDISEARQHELQARISMELLQRRTQELEAVNEELNKFTSAITHDLQEPVRSVVSFLQLFERSLNYPMSTLQSSYLNHAINGGHRLKLILEGMVRYATVALRPLHVEPLSLANWLPIIVADWKSAQLESACVTIELPADLPTVFVDQIALQTVFTELLDNAWHYRQPDIPLRIQITVVLDAKGWLFTLLDNGQGIDPSYAGRLFRLFEHQHAEVEAAGPGLGLPICQKLIERLGGTIGIVEELTVGSGIWFILPNRSV